MHAFRTSISDMHMPVNELVRLVRLYSTPWEEKSTALKKLHEDYEAKKTQLNIALKRLEMIDAYVSYWVAATYNLPFLFKLYSTATNIIFCMLQHVLYYMQLP